MSLLIVNEKYVNADVYQNRINEAIATKQCTLHEIASRTGVEETVLRKLINGRSIQLLADEYCRLALFCLSLPRNSFSTPTGVSQ